MWRRRRVNTKRTPSPVRPFDFWFPLLLVVVLSVVYLSMDNRCRHLANDLGALEQRLQEYRQHRAVEEVRWRSLSTLKSVRAQLARFGVPMEWAGGDRTIYITRWSPTPPEPVQPAAQVARTGVRERRE